jgi:predicted nuclease of predicted toxin-antitoxin system
MKVLLNENIPLLAVEALRELGHDVLWARTAMRGAPDTTVLERALAEGRLVVTFDKDFGELVYGAGKKASSGVVLFRIPQPSAVEVARQIVATFQSRADWQGNFSVVEPGRIRMVPLPETGNP